MKEVSVQELKSMQDNNENFVLIDVREQHEFEIAQIGGTLIPMGEVMDNLDKIPKDPDTKVIVHCRSGGRSGAIVQALEGMHGYTNCYNLTGGILAYADQIDPSLTKY